MAARDRDPRFARRGARGARRLSPTDSRGIEIGGPTAELTTQIHDSAPERLGELREATPEVNAETVEQRFAPDAARERQRRVDVAEETKQPRKP